MRVDPSQSLLLSSFSVCVYVHKTLCICKSVDTSACLLAGKKNTAEKSVHLVEYQLGFLQTLKRSQFKFQRQHIMRPAGGLTAVEKYQSRYMVQ